MYMYLQRKGKIFLVTCRGTSIKGKRSKKHLFACTLEQTKQTNKSNLCPKREKMIVI